MSAILTPARKKIIREFIKRATYDPRCYGKPLSEKWRVKLLIFIRYTQADRSVHEQDVNRWIKAHKWISGPLPNPRDANTATRRKKDNLAKRKATVAKFVLTSAVKSSSPVTPAVFIRGPRQIRFPSARTIHYQTRSHTRSVELKNIVNGTPAMNTRAARCHLSRSMFANRSSGSANNVTSRGRRREKPKPLKASARRQRKVVSKSKAASNANNIQSVPENALSLGTSGSKSTHLRSAGLNPTKAVESNSDLADLGVGNDAPLARKKGNEIAAPVQNSRSIPDDLKNNHLDQEKPRIDDDAMDEIVEVDAPDDETNHVPGVVVDKSHQDQEAINEYIKFHHALQIFLEIDEDTTRCSHEMLELNEDDEHIEIVDITNDAEDDAAEIVDITGDKHDKVDEIVETNTEQHSELLNVTGINENTHGGCLDTAGINEYENIEDVGITDDTQNEATRPNEDQHGKNVSIITENDEDTHGDIGIGDTPGINDEDVNKSKELDEEITVLFIGPDPLPNKELAFLSESINKLRPGGALIIRPRVVRLDFRILLRPYSLVEFLFAYDFLHQIRKDYEKKFGKPVPRNLFNLLVTIFHETQLRQTAIFLREKGQTSVIHLEIEPDS